jgi:hypothetical protein
MYMEARRPVGAAGGAGAACGVLTGNWCMVADIRSAFLQQGMVMKRLRF